MLLATLLTALRRRAARREPIAAIFSRSWPELAEARLRPGDKTWLVARAVSLRAF